MEDNINMDTQPYQSSPEVSILAGTRKLQKNLEMEEASSLPHRVTPD